RGRLQAYVGKTADLGERALETPHQLERPLCALRRLERMKPSMARQRRNALVQPRVVLHRARTERVKTRVEIEVAPRQPVVVADDLGLGNLGKRRRSLAQKVRRDQLVERSIGNVEHWKRRRAAVGHRTLEDGDRLLALPGCLCDPVAHASTASCRCSRSALTERASTSASFSMSVRERRSVIATSRPSSYSG